MMKNTIAIILAAGRGKRLGTFYGNKVLMPLFGKPLIVYAVELFEKLTIPIFMVVGYGKTKVKKQINTRAFFVEQKDLKGTGHAVASVLPVINRKVENVFVAMGDHAFAFKSSMLRRMYQEHVKVKAEMTILTLKTVNYRGYGLVVKNKFGKIEKIIDGKNRKAQSDQTAEITPGLYLFKSDFLKEFLPKLQLDPISQEIFISDLAAVANKNNQKINIFFSSDKRLAVGINTFDDYKKAEYLLRK